MKIENGKVVIGLYDLFSQLTTEQRAEVIDLLACQQEIITEVANQIIDGSTTLGSYGPRGFGGNPDATHGIDGARMRIAKASSEIVAEEIAALKQQIDREKELGRKGWAAYHELLNRNSLGRFA